jgi:ABC-type transporter Mla subunit MlaD
MARTLDQLADKLANAAGPQDADSQKLANQRAQAEQLRSQIEKSAADLQKAGAGGAAGVADLARMRQEYSRQLQQAQQLVDQLRREDPSFAQGGVGFTFEGQGMTLSAPGTEAFKQDFAKWEKLRGQATEVLEKAETSISKRMQAREGNDARDRLASGVDDKPPAAYETEVNSYFKALADRKKPY